MDATLIAAKNTVSARKTGVDLLKLLSVLFIPLLHFCSYFFQDQTNQASFFIMHFIRWITFSGVGMFMVISGYLYAKREFNKKHVFGILNFVFTFLIFSVFTAIALHGGKLTWNSFSAYFFQFSGYFWFVNYWISMLFFIPFINKAVSVISKSQYFILLGALIFFICLPQAIKQMNDIWSIKLYLPDYWTTELFPIVFTVLGAGFSKFEFKINKLLALGLFLSAPILNTILDIVYCNKYIPGTGAHLYVFNTYSNPLSILLIFGLFALLYNVNLPKRFAGFAKFISSLSFEMYLALMVTDKIASNLVALITVDSYILKGLVWVTAEFVFSLSIAVIFHYTFGKLWGLLPFNRKKSNK